MMRKFRQIVEFIREQYGTTEFIPLHEPRFRGNEKKYLNECIDSTFVSSVGKFVDLFEAKVAEYTGSPFAVAAVNGTSALHTALVLSGVNRNHEVVTQPLTFVATVNAIRYTGASPVFLDVDRDTLGLSPLKLKQWIDDNTVRKFVNGEPRTINKKSGKIVKACVPMHTFGHPCRIDEINEICKDYNIDLIEDAAESIGSFYKGKHTGTFGKAGVVSFNGNKIITTGGGGIILTQNESLAKQAKHLTTQAKLPHKWEYVHDVIGYNYRLTNLAAALGVAQMEQLQGFLTSKRKLAEKYMDFFEKMNIYFISEPENAHSNYWLNAILMENIEERDSFLDYSNSLGVMTRPAWRLMNQLEMFKEFETGDLSNALWLAERLVNLPSSVL